ncbi:MAG: hypothetical protein GY777_29545 [Candidatus Brocadiaceae bacterium]|nr:hypothetical protein [Candidatus Brocadiaceae bacterium]
MISLIQAIKNQEDKHKEHDNKIDRQLDLLFNNKKCDAFGIEYEVNENNEIINRK